MHDAKKAQDKAVETMTVWADANQRVLSELAELSTATAKEGVRLYAELQQSAIQALREWPTTWQDAPRDPFAWWFRIAEGNAQAATRTAERLQTTAEQTHKAIQESLAHAVTKIKEVYAA